MGTELINYYRTKIKKEYKIAFFSTFLAVLLIHLYKFSNTLPNHDSLYNFYSDQNVLGSGRWALSLACGLSSYYDLPWIIGLFSCVFIALTVVVIVAVFKIKNPVLIVLTGGLLAASPATTETFFFLFTADGYMIAMLLASLSVYFSRIEEKRITRQVLSAVCICVACGIYQAYVSYSLILAVCYFMDILLQNQHDKKECCAWVLRQIVIYIGALACYYVIWKICLYVSNTPVNSYQGISEVGKISFSLLLGGVVHSIKTTILYFLQWDVTEHGFTLYAVLSVIFGTAFIIGLIHACIKSKIVKRKWALGLLTLCIVAIVPFACMWHFTSESVGYRAMMLQSYTLLFVLMALLYERWGTKIAKNLACLLLTGIILNNTLMANISYFYMNLCYERTYADGVEMVMEIHDLEDQYDFDKVAVLGSRVNDVQLQMGASNLTGDPEQIHMLSSLLETNLLFDSEHLLPFLNATFGMRFKSVDRSEREQLAETEAVQNMGCWPDGDSMTVIDDTLIIKLSNAEKEG